jgi:hypothetical protein
MWEQHEAERTLIINIDLTRHTVVWIALALVAFAALGILAWSGGEATAAGEETSQTTSLTGLRQYYLTKFVNNGGGADTACADGYHMASLWEILDPSNLEYNTDLGYLRDDSGSGPPSYKNGWVRTGYQAVSDDTNISGRANCDAWTSSAGDVYGTLAWLPRDWAASETELHVWVTGWHFCDSVAEVWCVED